MVVVLFGVIKMSSRRKRPSGPSIKFKHGKYRGCYLIRTNDQPYYTPSTVGPQYNYRWWPVGRGKGHAQLPNDVAAAIKMYHQTDYHLSMTLTRFLRKIF